MKYLIRVDDYPQGLYPPDAGVDSLRYKEFHAVFEEMGLPYCLGVVPAMLRDDHRDYLQTLKNVTIAQHGSDHRIGFENKSTTDINEEIMLGREMLKDFKPYVYIPPFNELGRLELFDIVRNCGFKIITGGAESEKVMPGTLSIRMLWGVIYVPSHRHLYNHAKKMIDTIGKIKGCNVAAVTFHWLWEIHDLSYLRQILEMIKNDVIGWDNIPMKYIQPSQYPMKVSSRIPFTEIVNTIEPGSTVLDMGSSNSALPALMAQA